MRALLVVVLLASAALAGPRAQRVERVERGGGRSGVSAPFFSFAPPSGAGLPVAQTLCSQLTSAELDGGWCLDGDGTTATGSSVTMQAVGAPSLLSLAVCPNGPDCSALQSIYLTGTTRYEASAATATITSGFTVCMMVQRENATLDRVAVAHYNAAAAGSWHLGVQSATSDAPDWTIFDTTGTAKTLVHATTYTTGALHFVCGTTNGAATPTQKICIDGACTTGSAQPNPIGSTSIKDSVAAVAGGTVGIVGNYHGAFVIHGVLGDARIAAIARAVLADAPTSTKGIALSCTRASASSCPQPYDTEASVTDLPANRCCIAGGPAGTGALARYGAYTEQLLRTSELDNVAWTSVGTPTMTANSTIAPNGTLTADTLGDDDGAAFEGKTQNVTVTAASATTLSVYAKAGTGTKLRLSNDGTACDFTVGATWVRYKCADASASGTSTAQQVLVGNAVGDTGNIIVWRANLTQTNRLMPSVDATSAAVNVAETIPLMTIANATVRCMASSMWGHGRTSGVDHAARPIGLAYASGGTKQQDSAINANRTWNWYGWSPGYTWNTTTTYTDETIGRFAWSGDGATARACINGVCESSAQAWVPFTNVTVDYYLGGQSAAYGAAIDGWIWNVQADPNPLRCR